MVVELSVMVLPCAVIQSRQEGVILEFDAAKTILYLILPPAGPLILMTFGFLLVKPCRDFGKFLIAAGFLLLYASSISLVSDALLKPLETGFPAARDEPIKADAIVVLGGGVHDLAWLGKGTEPSRTSLERTVEGVRLHRLLHLPLVFLGGKGDPARTAGPDAEAMERTALALGVAAKDILIESKSRNTLEGAQALKGLIKGNRIVLVTSAYHLKRASAMFTKQRFHVIPAPAGYQYEKRPLSPYSFIPHAGSLDASSTALSEYYSLLWYRLNGAI